MNKHLMLITGATLLALGVLKLFPPASNEIEEFLQSLPENSLSQAPNILENPESTICVLKPYEDRIIQSGPAEDRINEYLKHSRYSANEGKWAVIYNLGNMVKSFELSTKENIPRLNNIPQDPPLVANTSAIIQKQCSRQKTATFLKIKSSLTMRNDLYFGERKNADL